MSAIAQSTAPRAAAGNRRPLVVRLCNWVGEVVLSLPAMQRLETAGYDLHLVGKGWSRALLTGTNWPVATRPAAFGAAVRQLRDLRVALGAVPTAASAAPRALLFTKSLSSALETRFARLPAVGYAYDGRSLLLAAAHPLPHFEHAAHMYWHLVSLFLGQQAPYPEAVDLRPSLAQQQAAEKILATHGIAAGGFVLLCPLSGADDVQHRKVWPGFAALGHRLQAQSLPMVVCPGPGEEPAAAATLPQALQLTGVDLGVYAALLARARCVVANDTGPGHLAAAVGARLISIYGPHSIAAWAPLGGRVKLFHSLQGWPEDAEVEAAVLS
jgi:heptosyltransferase-2